MKIILGQGNPGAPYRSSRHNVGFMALDELARAYQVDFVKKPKFQADIAELTLGGEKTLLVKPTTFYNETGRTARLLVDFYKASPLSDILVIHDDLSLPFGTLRIRQKGSDAGNNGIKSLNAHLGPDYCRIRVGIYNDLSDRIDSAQFVLAGFTKAEAETLEGETLPAVTKLIAEFCADSLQTTSHTL